MAISRLGQERHDRGGSGWWVEHFDIRGHATVSRDSAHDEHATVLKESRGVVHPGAGEPSHRDRGIVDRIVNGDRIGQRSVRQLASSDQCSLVRQCDDGAVGER